MKTNYRRTNKSNGFDYGYMNFVKRFKVGLGGDHDGGHRGSAREIKEVKTLDRRQARRKANNAVLKSLKESECHQLAK